MIFVSIYIFFWSSFNENMFKKCTLLTVARLHTNDFCCNFNFFGSSFNENMFFLMHTSDNYTLKMKHFLYKCL